MMAIYRLRPIDGPACTGEQLAAVINAAAREMHLERWFISDVRPVGSWALGARGPEPVSVSLDALLAGLQAISQLESGVFSGLREDPESPRFRDGGVWTEDADSAPLGDTVVEIRAFDTSFIEVIAQEDVSRQALQTMQSVAGLRVVSNS